MPVVIETPAFILATVANPAGAPRSGDMVVVPQHLHGEVASVAAWYF